MRAHVVGLAVGVLLAGCWDWSLSPRQLPRDGVADRLREAAADVPAREWHNKVDGKPTDAPTPDARKDGPRIDGKKDGKAPPDGSKPDGPGCGAGCTGANAKCSSGICEVECPSSGPCSCPPNTHNCKLKCQANECTNGTTCNSTGRCEIDCVNGGCQGPLSCGASVAECVITCNGGGTGTCTGAITCAQDRPCSVTCDKGGAADTCTDSVNCSGACRCAVTCLKGACTGDVNCLDPSCVLSPKGCTTAGPGCCAPGSYCLTCP